MVEFDRDLDTDSQIYGTPLSYAKRDSDIDKKIYGSPWEYAKREETDARDVE
ncbi:hypothetical protein EYZ11_000015 [Aspergillus tanneri]|uniref:Uncharacterized protein n=1 Tax=Aspergillus tanneri TaxID=1220188 RepID=A0A4V3UQV1_9EURO|nr:hypothetical protein EYZ11_000015 [Aspergillus tanneri]